MGERDEFNFSTLSGRGITKTDTHTLPVTQTLISGIPVGQGACKAIVLRLNSNIRNNTAAGLVTATYFYWGDAQKQENEVLRGIDSIVIFCKNQEEVFVRNAFSGVINIQVVVYR